ncbi:MAG: two-component system sensor histidine kinase BarA [Gammaproteobacteria bacterium]|jgi:two-component system sensor histidine kinase BarA
MNRLGIKYQIFFIALIPAFLTDVFFSYTHYSNNIDQQYNLLQSNGKIIAEQLAGASELSMLSGNYAQIQYLLKNTIDANGIVLASAYDLEGNIIAEAISDQYDAKKTAHYFYYRQTIVTQGIQHSGAFTPDQTDQDRYPEIGWLHLYISQQALEKTKASILYDSIAIFIVVLIIALLLSVIISAGITGPILKLLNHLKRFQTGEPGKVIESLESNEMGELQKKIDRMTQALLTNRNDLNDKIHLATSQLSEAIDDLKNKNMELVLAKDKAQQANKMKTMFLTNISHEIRTPINGIRGFINLMAQSDLNPTQKRYADIILKSTNDLTDIISEILDFSKIESGKLQIIEDTFDLYDVVQQSRDILLINVFAKKFDLILIIYSDTPRYVGGDKLRLKQILLNLIGNAIKFTDEGEVVIKVSVEQQTDIDVNILITVEDTGIGISEKDQETLFEAFSQVEKATNRRFTGTGLGLVISKNLTGLMAGDITLESKLGVGTKFSVRLPFSLMGNQSDLFAADNTEHKAALILSTRKNCLQEVLTLFDGGQIPTESILISASDSAEFINSSIRNVLDHIDFLVFDLRHLNLDLKQVLEDIPANQIRVITIHYDQSMVTNRFNKTLEFLPITINSLNLKKTLDDSKMDVPVLSPGTQMLMPPRLTKRVLLVDDNLINLKLASELIQLWGHQLRDAENAHQAIELYRKEDFDLIVLDIQMPEIDGVDLLEMMRREKPQDTTPIVALTANLLDDEPQRLLTLGFDDYLRKPINETKFRALLDGSYQMANIQSEMAIDETNTTIKISVDFGQSLQLSQNNRSILRKILAVLIRDIPTIQQQLETALLQFDREKLSAIVHKIQGITCYTSLPRLKQQVRSLQQFLAIESNTLNRDMVMEVYDELAKIEEEVTLLLREMDSTSEV